MFDLPADDPVGHGVDVEAGNVAPHPVRLDQRGAAPHERVGDGDPFQVVGAVECLPERLVAVFGEQQTAKQCPRSPGKPLVHGDDRPVVLLDLLFPQGQVGDEGDVEVFFYGHGGSYMFSF